jgi:hypothetical protein
MHRIADSTQTPMKKLSAFCSVMAIVLLPGFAALRAAPSAESAPAVLRDTLERVYSDYLESVEREDAKLLLAVLPSARIADLKRTFEMNSMRFPDDYFATMRKYAPKMPPTGKFQFLATTDSARYANLIYVGNMNGYLRKDTDERRFLIVQFEKENDGWKYGVVIDPPVRLVPDFERKLGAGQLDFITQRPFTAEKIELRP